MIAGTGEAEVLSGNGQETVRTDTVTVKIDIVMTVAADIRATTVTGTTTDLRESTETVAATDPEGTAVVIDIAGTVVNGWMTKPTGHTAAVKAETVITTIASPVDSSDNSLTMEAAVCCVLLQSVRTMCLMIYVTSFQFVNRNVNVELNFELVTAVLL